jgi:hypothetical protein
MNKYLPKYYDRKINAYEAYGDEAYDDDNYHDDDGYDDDETGEVRKIRFAINGSNTLIKNCIDFKFANQCTHLA